MELEGFQRVMDRVLDDHNIPVQAVATDRHRSIGATMKKKYGTINHQFDIWHLGKGT